MINKVREFQITGEQIVNNEPTINEFKDCMLRYNLMKEENGEYLTAVYEESKVEILDALVDQMYVLLGTINFHGMQNVFDEAFNRVHANNMSKFVDGKVLRDENGKIKKPDNFKPVDLSDLV